MRDSHPAGDRPLGVAAVVPTYGPAPDLVDTLLSVERQTIQLRAVLCAAWRRLWGFPEPVHHGSGGLFFDRTVDGLSVAMRRLTEEAGLAPTLGLATRERWFAELSPENIVRRYAALYREVPS